MRHPTLDERIVYGEVTNQPSIAANGRPMIKLELA